MGQLDTLNETVGKFRCNRCGFYFLVEDLVEEEETKAIVCVKCLDKPSFEEEKSDEGAAPIEHYFKT